MATCGDPEDIGQVRGPDDGETFRGSQTGWNNHDVAYDALSVRQPWAYSITHLNKRIENRSWPLSRATVMTGRRFAIHAAQKIDAEAVVSLHLRGHELPERFPTSAVVAVAVMSQTLRHDQARLCFPEQAEWILGPICLVLEDVIVLPEPVPCSGALGWWLMSDNARLSVARQVREIEASHRG